MNAVDLHQHINAGLAGLVICLHDACGIPCAVSKRQCPYGGLTLSM